MWLIMAVIIGMSANCQIGIASALRLDETHFDQDIRSGWRALDARGCKAEAANLIKSYRLAGPHSNERELLWHEGQLRAGLGQNLQAIRLFRRTKKPAQQDTDGWNHYVDGTIAFLRGNRRELTRARNALAALPPPKTPETLTINGKVIQVPWPPNLNVLDGLLKCFGQPYDRAYACAQPFLKVELPDEG